MSEILELFLLIYAGFSTLWAALLLLNGFMAHPWKEISWAELVVIVLLWPGFATLGVFMVSTATLIAGAMWLYERLDRPILKDKR